MSLRKLLLMLPLLLVLGTTACDNDNKSNAQDMGDEPGAMEAECPCFTVEDVVNLGEASTAVECVTIIYGMALSFNSTGSPELTTSCFSNGTGCMCSGQSGEMDITQDEYGVCLINLINGAFIFNSESAKLEICNFG